MARLPHRYSEPGLIGRQNKYFFLPDSVGVQLVCKRGTKTAFQIGRLKCSIGDLEFDLGWRRRILEFVIRRGILIPTAEDFGYVYGRAVAHHESPMRHPSIRRQAWSRSSIRFMSSSVTVLDRNRVLNTLE